MSHHTPSPRKLTAEQVREILTRIRFGHKLYVIALDFGVSAKCISHIANGATYKEIKRFTYRPPIRPVEAPQSIARYHDPANAAMRVPDLLAARREPL